MGAIGLFLWVIQGSFNGRFRALFMGSIGLFLWAIWGPFYGCYRALFMGDTGLFYGCNRALSIYLSVARPPPRKRRPIKRALNRP